MQGAFGIKDRYGLTMTTSSRKAADAYVEGLDLFLSQNFGPDERFEQAIQADDGFALAHAGMGLIKMFQANMPEAKASLEKARLLAINATKRERQSVEAVALFVNGEGPKSLALIREHLKEFPRDMLMLRIANRLFMLGCSGAGVACFPDEMLAMLKGVERSYGEDWAFLGQYAFAHHEAGLLKEAFGYAERSLDIMPTNANACHSVAHVYFETGDASGGQTFLGGWLAGYDKRAPFHVHLSWHQALFELANCRYDRVLDLYENHIRPSVQARSAQSLADSASLMWRMNIYSGEKPPVPWDEVKEQATPATDNAGPAFRDAHAALALASCDDALLGKLTDRLKSAANDGNKLASEITLPLVKAIGAFAQGEYAKTVRLMEPIVPQLTRIGGSHAQREVFEDTYVEACLRAEEYDKAFDELNSRLKRRSSVRDSFWLARAQLGSGQAEDAATNLRQASQHWQYADAASPEMANLNRLVRSI
jgi:tetratricopeptide (TPR) repeat protein